MTIKNSEAIVVLGAGPAGAVAATLLADAGRVVTLIDEQTNLNFKVGETLPANAAMALAKAGIRQICNNIPTLPCAGNRSFWGSEILQIRSSLTNPYGCGWHLDRVAFDTALINRAMSAGVVFKPGSRLTRTVRNKNGWDLQFSSSQGSFSRDCGWVLDATGRRAVFARAQGAKRLAVDKLVAVVGVFCSSRPVDADLTISIESAPEGWWYSAQVPSSCRIVIYFTDGDLLKRSGAKEQRTWFRLASGTQLIREFTNNPAYLLTAPLKVTLADTSRLDCPAADGWLAIGDSACAIDPLSSAGITDAIKSAIGASQVVLESKPGRKTTISDYASKVTQQHIRNNHLRYRYYHMEQRWPRSESGFDVIPLNAEVSLEVFLTIRFVAAVALLLGAICLAQTPQEPHGVARPLSAVTFKEDEDIKCLKYAVEAGNPDTGPSTHILEFPNGCHFPWHFHQAEEQMLVIDGEVSIQMGTQPAALLAPGGFAIMKSREPHQFSCQSSNGCKAFVQFDRKYDIHWVKK